jgi:F-type H+-transporting ATPase subunit b
MHIDLWTLGLQAINVLVLVWLLARFLFRPVAGMVAQRRQATAALLADAEAARAQAQAAAAEVTHQREGLAAEVDGLRAAARQDAAAERATQMAQARAEADRVRADAAAALARERSQLQAALEARACTLAVDIARRLLDRLPSGAITTALAGMLADDLAALPQAERALLAAAPERFEVVTAVALDAAGQAAVMAALTRALGTPPAPAFRVDPALLAGIELRGPHTRISSSWRSDLDRIAGELAAEHEDAG